MNEGHQPTVFYFFSQTCLDQVHSARREIRGLSLILACATSCSS
jgi:hypothetical protein